MSDRLPLEGIRICDFSAVWAGQSATMYLADMGADCVKVENPFVWNPMTRAASPRINPMIAAAIPAWLGGHPKSDPGRRPWNNAPAFIHVMRNKKSFTVDSRRPEGLAIVKALIRISDVLAENLALGTLEKLGLSDDTIRDERPDIVILHMPGFGRTGEYREGRGYGAHMDAVGGSTILRGYRETSPYTNVQIFAGDFFAGMHGAFATLAALRHRRRTGEGQVIELSQAECSAQMFPQAALDAAWNRREQRSIGNRSIEGFVPNGVFPCAGIDGWIAISCRTDGEWAALVGFMGSPAWAEGLATTEARAAREDEIEGRLAEWTATQDRDGLFRALQQAGVTAGPVLNAADAANDPHLAETGAWRLLPATADYPATEFAVPPYRFSESNVTIRTAPCALGEHNDYVYRELLGLPEEDRRPHGGRAHHRHLRPRRDRERMSTRDIDANGITLRVTEEGEGRPVLLLHGFPELAYSYRHQLPVLAAAGYRAIAPDQRGYGGSSRPEPIEAYDLNTLAADALALMDALGERGFVVVGHDWGAPVAWHLALTEPDRIRGVVGLSVPFSQRSPGPPLDLMRAAAGPDHIFYVDYFQAPGIAEGEFEANVRDSLLGFYWSISGGVPREERFRPIPRGGRFIDSFAPPATLPAWLTEEDLQGYVDAFTRTGFAGGLNWYRNMNRNWERSAHLAGAKVEVPALFITGSHDPARNPGAIDRLPENCTDLRGLHILEGCGHWTQQERRDDVNRLLLEFLAGLG